VILDAQVKQAVDSQMAAKGFTKVVDGDKADLLLGFRLTVVSIVLIISSLRI